MGWLTNVWNAITGKKTTVKPSKVNLVGFLDSLSGSSDVTLSSTYMSCVNCHARHFSKILPTHYFGKEISKGKHNNFLLQLQPNDYQTAPTLWKSVAFNYFFGSVAILWLEFDYSNLAEPLKSIWSLDVDANQIRVFINDEGKQYCSFSINGQVHYVAAEDLIILQREVDMGIRCPYCRSSNTGKWKKGWRILTGIFTLGISEATIHKRYCYNCDNYYTASGDD